MGLKETLRLEYLNSFVMNFVSLPTFVNFAHIVCDFFFFSHSFLFLGMIYLFKSVKSFIVLYLFYYIFFFLSVIHGVC